MLQSVTFGKSFPEKKVFLQEAQTTAYVELECGKLPGVRMLHANKYTLTLGVLAFFF